MRSNRVKKPEFPEEMILFYEHADRVDPGCLRTAEQFATASKLPRDESGRRRRAFDLRDNAAASALASSAATKPASLPPYGDRAFRECVVRLGGLFGRARCLGFGSVDLVEDVRHCRS